MGCTLFWEAQEFSGTMQVRCRDELISLAEGAGWDYEVAEDTWSGIVVNLNARPERARPMRVELKTIGITMFPFDRGDEVDRPRLSFVFDNSDMSSPELRNRLITIAPPAYWREWMPRVKGQYPALSEERAEPVYGMRTDGMMRVRRTELPGFIKFLNTLRATALPLLDIRTSDRLARKMINDPTANPFGRNPQPRPLDQATLDELSEGLGVLFNAPRFPDWKLGLDTEDQIEREQQKANRAATMSQEPRRGSGSGRGRGGSDSGRGGRDSERGGFGRSAPGPERY
jgi:hypothetical protein